MAEETFVEKLRKELTSEHGNPAEPDAGMTSDLLERILLQIRTEIREDWREGKAAGYLGRGDASGEPFRLVPSLRFSRSEFRGMLPGSSVYQAYPFEDNLSRISLLAEQLGGEIRRLGVGSCTVSFFRYEEEIRTESGMALSRKNGSFFYAIHIDMTW